MQAGALNLSGIKYLTIGEGAEGAATYTQAGGDVSFTPGDTGTSGGIYINNSTSGTGNAEFTITDGSFNVTGTNNRIWVGRGATGTSGKLTIGGGAR